MDQSFSILSGIHLLGSHVHMQKKCFAYVSPFWYGGHLFLEVVTFSAKEKLFFWLWWKNTSSYKNFIKKSISFSYKWNSLKFSLHTKARNATAKNQIFGKMPKISKFVKIWILLSSEQLLSRAEQLPMKAFFSFHMGANTCW